MELLNKTLITDRLNKYTKQVNTLTVYPNLVTEATDNQFETITRKVNLFFKRVFGINQPFEFFGLPYTSSGSFAGLWNTNKRFNASFQDERLFIDTNGETASEILNYDYEFTGIVADNDNRVYLMFSQCENDSMTRLFELID